MSSGRGGIGIKIWRQTSFKKNNPGDSNIQTGKRNAAFDFSVI